METNDVRCPKCNVLLFRARGLGTVIEIKCRKCGSLVQYPKLEPVLILRVKPQRKPGPTHVK